MVLISNGALLSLRYLDLFSLYLLVIFVV